MPSNFTSSDKYIAVLLARLLLYELSPTKYSNTSPCFKPFYDSQATFNLLSSKPTSRLHCRPRAQPLGIKLPAVMVTEKTFSSYTKDQGANYAKLRRGYHPNLYKTVVDYHTSSGGKLDTLLDIGCGKDDRVPQFFSPHISTYSPLLLNTPDTSQKRFLSSIR
jgi:hypothetical protein